MDKTIAGKTVSVNDEGYMKDFTQWNKEIGTAIAAESGITMTDRHWAVIDYVQGEFKKDSPLSIRKVNKSGVIDIKEFYQLFPQGPLKTASKIAGIPKPASCI
jgi:TusE/DsrC/DsvC family sulfur relay protein